MSSVLENLKLVWVFPSYMSVDIVARLDVLPASHVGLTPVVHYEALSTTPGIEFDRKHSFPSVADDFGIRGPHASLLPNKSPFHAIHQGRAQDRWRADTAPEVQQRGNYIVLTPLRRSVSSASRIRGVWTLPNLIL
ncbi:hypothetical protein PC128_g21571 [Phytophthora cactorum]|nr:hypothetical protein C6341_g23435 [Phytophthora cactorum]KAG3158027.1 hypothetical protein PC128_g21571 [Phytophthora cactorum]